MSPSGFVHLHVASGYSLQYGASHPHTLVERAAEQDGHLALTDRDGTYGAVKFAKACLAASIRPCSASSWPTRRRALVVPGRPRPERPAPRSGRRDPGWRPRAAHPGQGGAFREPRLPPVTLLAHAGAQGGPAGRRCAGWCRPPTWPASGGVRSPRSTCWRLLATGDVLVLLGPASSWAGRHPGAAPTSPSGRWPAGARSSPPRTSSSSWSPTGCRGRQGVWGPGTSAHAARMAQLARRAGLGVCSPTPCGTYADRRDAPTVDVLDAARRLVPLGSVDLHRVGGLDGELGQRRGFLKSGKQMHEVAGGDLPALAGGVRAGGPAAARAHPRRGRPVRPRPAGRFLGLGEIHFPELELAGGPSGGVPGGGADLPSPREPGIGRWAARRPHSRGWWWRADGAAAAKPDAARCPAPAAPSGPPTADGRRPAARRRVGGRYGSAGLAVVWKRLDDELEMIRQLGYASYSSPSPTSPT
ncbi:MAG: hypothetical protein R2731_02650 [Nocardioides sp.]